MAYLVGNKFSRIDTRDTTVDTSDVICFLVNRDGAWKLNSDFVKGNLTLWK